MAAGGGEEEGGVGELSDELRARIEVEVGKWNANINKKNIGDAGAVYVAEKLRGTTVVEELALYGCGIGAVGARALVASLGEHNATLRLLNLGRNKSIGDAGAQAMAEMVKKNTTLEKLGLYGCGVGPRGARALGEALQENDSLKEIYLGANDLGGEGAEALAEALRWNESLKELYLSDCELTDVGASALLSALRESNSTLTRLNLGENDIKNYDEIIAPIEALLDENYAVRPALAERRARCLLFCCLKLAPSAHEHVVPSVGAVPVPVMQYAVEHAGEMHVAKRFEVGNEIAGQSSSGVRSRSASFARRRR